MDETLSGQHQEANINSDPYLTSEELYQYLHGVVPLESPRQTPVDDFASDEFKNGEMVFKLPERETIISAPKTNLETNSINCSGPIT